MSYTGECRQQKHTQHAPSTKTECDYLNGWIKKRSHTQKSHPKVVNPRDIAGERKKKKKKNYRHYCIDVYIADSMALYLRDTLFNIFLLFLRNSLFNVYVLVL